ncbi:MAG TPA: hypothetical protein VL096_13720, partial [Pirellulaceae bacterium]|nr:hypothetical protein [Pirellulaceae bacterium]
MKLSKMALAAAIYSAVFAGTASAQGLRQPSSIQQTSFTNSYYAQAEDQPSPSDVPPPADEMIQAKGGDCDACAEDAAEESCERWFALPQDHCSGVTV